MNIQRSSKWGIIHSVLTLLIIFIGFKHLVNPAPFLQFLPAWFPFPMAAVLFSGVAEVVLAVWWRLPKSRYGHWGALLVFLMMCVYLPLHIIDALRPTPVIAHSFPISVQAAVAWGRVVLQIIFILCTWKIFLLKNNETA